MHHVHVVVVKSIKNVVENRMIKRKVANEYATFFYMIGKFYFLLYKEYLAGMLLVIVIKSRTNSLKKYK